MTKEEFKLLSDNEKRIELAKDVLLQLDKKKYVPTTGVYLANTNLFHEVISIGKNETSLQKILSTVGTCHVCAIGALFVSDVLMNNEYELNFKHLNLTSYHMVQKLDFFSPDQLRLMESYFEKYNSYSTILTSIDRLTYIMNNIIENNGEFIPK